MSPITLGNYQDRLSEDLRLGDYRMRTREAYVLALRQFFVHTKREPADVTEEELRDYFLHLRDVRRISPSYLNIAVCALRFFFLRSMRQPWDVFDLLRVQRPKTLPIVLSRAEVARLLAVIKLRPRWMALVTIYALGLRLGEGLRLESTHIDSDRNLVWIRDAKGGKDRTVPLPRPLLARLRDYWKHERPASPTRLLFVPERGDKPFDETTLQKTFTAALRDTKLEKHATIHTLRHSYATHLVEAGVSLRTVQSLLGHSSLRTTEVYLHVTTSGAERVQDAVDALVYDLFSTPTR